MMLFQYCSKTPLELLLKIVVFVMMGFFGFTPHTNAASTQGATAQSTAVQVFASADESSPVIESASDGKSLSPIAEMTGAGGLKWFMVKTKNGNVGWIKASDTAGAARIDEHFRALPKDAVSITPASIAPAFTSTTSSTGAITIPVRMERTKVLVPVTLTNAFSSVTAVLVVDTGASRTMISKRLARELRLLATDTRTGEGVGASFVADVSQVESVRVGDAEIKNIRVTIHDGSNAFGGEGLLGFDFLGRFRMSLDADKSVMVLTPRS